MTNPESHPAFSEVDKISWAACATMNASISLRGSAGRFAHHWEGADTTDPLVEGAVQFSIEAVTAYTDELERILDLEAENETAYIPELLGRTTARLTIDNTFQTSALINEQINRAHTDKERGLLLASSNFEETRSRSISSALDYRAMAEPDFENAHAIALLLRPLYPEHLPGHLELDSWTKFEDELYTEDGELHKISDFAKMIRTNDAFSIDVDGYIWLEQESELRRNAGLSVAKTALEAMRAV